MRFLTVEVDEYTEWGDWGESTVSIVAMGLALAIAGLVQTLAVPTAQPVVAIELFVSLLVPTGLATGGYWLARHNASPDCQYRAATWSSIGIVAACGLGVWVVMYVSLEGGAIGDSLSFVTTFAAVGGASGFLAAVRTTPEIGERATESVSAPSPAPAADEPERLEEPMTVGDADTNGTDATAQFADADGVGRSAAPVTRIGAVDGPTGAAGPDDTDVTATGTMSESPAAPDSPSELPSAPVPESTPNRGPASPTGRGEDPSVDPRSESNPDVKPDSEPEWVPKPNPEPLSPLETAATVPSTTETVLEVLSDERSRVTLAVLYHGRDDGPRDVADLARAVAEHTDERPATVETGLRHATLPRLREIRAVEWTPATDRVGPSPHAVLEEGVRDATVLLEAFGPGTR